MIPKDVNIEEFSKAGIGMEDDTINAKELDNLLAVEDSLVVIDLRSETTTQDRKYKKVINISMEEMVTEVMEKSIPNKLTPIVLICEQSFQITRMVALSTYAYPTLKLMGYENIKILEDWSFGPG